MSAMLILVRHGETEGESSIRYHGRGDVALSELGRAQMRAAAGALREHRFERVFASNLSRAREGARLIASEHASVIEIADFAEVDFGLFEGLTAEEIRERYPVEFERWNRDRLAPDFTYPGGESRRAFQERVVRGLVRMLELWGNGERAPKGTSLLVAHRGVIRTIVRHLVEGEPHTELGSIQVLRYEGGWTVEALDLTEHLGELRLS